jgi:putative heme-binding domain-containing protein
LIVAAVSSLDWSAPSNAQTDKLKDPQSIAEGARLFAPTCGTGYCHGSGGSGGGAPKLRGRNFEPDYLFKTISNGVAGTPMIPFKSQYSEDQIWRLVAYIMSDAAVDSGAVDVIRAQPAAVAEAAASASSAVIGDANAGRSLFFDSSAKYSCATCHSFAGEGGTVGPDLSKTAPSMSARDLFAAIAMPPPGDGRYQTVAVTLKSGEKISGLQKEEDAESIRVYDTTELPPVLRTIQKSEVTKTEKLREPVMPKDYAAKYTVKQLLDIVTFLKSEKETQPVTLRDILGEK